MKTFFLYGVAVLMILAMGSCVGGTGLRTASLAKDEKISGVFTVILYGNQEYDSLNTIAFLDIEGDEYELVPYAPEFNYKVLENEQDKVAVEKALHFISTQNPDFQNSYIKRILDEGGNTIGYELRPFYRRWVYGRSDVLHVTYRLMEEGKVRVSIRLEPDVERRFMRDSDRLSR